MSGGLNLREAAVTSKNLSDKASFYGEKLHHVRFYDQRERNYVIYVGVDLDGRGWVC